MGRRRRRQRYSAPDGIDWRDPNMPVLRPWEFPDGTVGIRKIPLKEEQEFRAYSLRFKVVPSWRDDPTYNLGKKKRKRIK